VFSIAEAITPGGDLGLAMPVAQRILALFGGSVAVENEEQSGIRLTVSLQIPAGQNSTEPCHLAHKAY